jgi:hypothetical protein
MYIICSPCHPGGWLFLFILWLAYIIFVSFRITPFASPFPTGGLGEQVFERVLSDCYYVFPPFRFLSEDLSHLLLFVILYLFFLV